MNLSPCSKGTTSIVLWTLGIMIADLNQHILKAKMVYCCLLIVYSNSLNFYAMCECRVEAAWLNFFYRITEVLGYNWCNENLSRFTNKGNLPFWVIIFHESLFFLHLEVYTKFCPTLFLTCIFVIKLIAEEPVPIKPYSLIQLSLKTIFMCCRFIKYSATVVSMKFILLDQCSL